MNETLVIVHLSSIESYLTFFGVDSAIRLITEIKLAMLTHVGEILILDQGWDITEDAKVLRQSVLDLEQYRPLIVIHHCELTDVSPWQDGMKTLARQLRQMKTCRVRLGGFWASETATSGCVHEVQRHLRARNIPCYIDTHICAFEEETK